MKNIIFKRLPFAGSFLGLIYKSFYLHSLLAKSDAFAGCRSLLKLLLSKMLGWIAMSGSKTSTTGWPAIRSRDLLFDYREPAPSARIRWQRWGPGSYMKPEHLSALRETLQRQWRRICGAGVVACGKPLPGTAPARPPAQARLGCRLEPEDGRELRWSAAWSAAG